MDVKARRIEALRRRLAIIEVVRGQMLVEIGRAERELPSLMGDGRTLVGNPCVRAALKLERMDTRARKHLCAAVAALDTGDFGHALLQAMMLLAMTNPGEKPRSRRDEILAAADDRGVPRDELARAAGIQGPRSKVQDAVRQAVKRGRKRRPSP